MKIALLQDEIYLPSYGGGTKANRCLLEGLAERGHECRAFARALTRSSEGPTVESQFVQEMQARGIQVRTIRPNVYTFDHQGVQVEAMNLPDIETRRTHLVERIAAMQPDWVLVADDKRQFMLESALRAAPDHVLLLLQTIVQLPFGPLSVCPSSEITQLMHQASGLFVISEFAQDYVRTHAGLDAQLVHLPVYGSGPFPDLTRQSRKYVTMINPCSLKGVDIFLAMADRFPDTQFAAVPTWGADQGLLELLRGRPNVSLLAPDDNIDSIWLQTRILLVPSVWPETFGYVVPEAMLRGIPVIASNVGGLPEAKLGVEFLVDVTPGEWSNGDFHCPSQNVEPWFDALNQLLTDQVTFEDCARRSRAAAHEFLKSATTEILEAKLKRLNRSSSASQTSSGAVADQEDLDNSTKPIHPEFQRCMDEQPYSVVLNGIRLTVDRDVFPPDLGRCAQNMARIAGRIQPQSALDMGCGTGYLALSLKQNGVPDVWAADVHSPAVACTRKNAEANAHLGPIHVTQSNLFQNLPKDARFDLIVFNQPFGPGDGSPVCGCGSDGGYMITRRFLEEAPAHLKDQGVLIMAFSDREHARHSPETVAREMGYRVDVLLHEFYNESNNYIYEIRPPE